MEGFLAILFLAALISTAVCLLSALIKKLRKKPARGALKRAGLSAVFMIALFVAFGFLADTADEPADRNGSQIPPASGTAEEDRSVEPEHDGQNMKPQEDTASKTDTEQEKPQTEHLKDEAYIGDNIHLEHITDFSNGRAWIEFRETDRKKGSVQAARDAVNAALSNTAGKILYGLMNLNSEGNYRAGLIDPQGRLVWESPLTNNSIVLSETSAYRDGLAYCNFNGNDENLWLAIDAEGNIVFARPATEDFKILGSGGGYILMAEYTSDFDSNEWKIGAIDASGNLAMPFQVYEKTPPKGPDPVEPPSGEMPDPNYDYWGYLKYQEQLEAYEAYQSYVPETVPLTFGLYDSSPYYGCSYLGDGIFQLKFQGFYVLLNVKSQRVIRTEEIISRGEGRIEAFLSDFENGSATVLYNDEKTDLYGDYRVIGLRSISVLNTDGTLTVGDSNEWVQWTLRTDSMTFSEGMAFCDPDFVSTGATHSMEGAYYSFTGEEVVNIPAYRGKKVYIGDPFYSGYAALIVYGADGNAYVTVIDQNGEVMFDPKPGYASIYTSADGKYATAAENGAVTVFDIHGEPLLQVNYSEITPRDIYDSTVYNVRDGVLRVKDFYVNVETGTVIGLHQTIDQNFSVTKY